MNKIIIDYEFTNQPWGGGNQFLKALRRQLINRKIYAKKIDNAKIVIVNSHHFSMNFFLFYLKNKNLKVIHRIDGPLYLTRGKKYKYIDQLIHLFSKYFSHGVIFQSNWSKKKNLKLGFDPKIFNTVINNAPDDKIFYDEKKKITNKKQNIIASSWSSNKKKGFDYLEFLDKNLDFKNFNITFVGNSPSNFKHIKVIPPVNSKRLSKILNQNNYYFTGSRNDPCSNSLLEAINCGLIPIYIDSGGHREIVRGKGIGFKNKKQLLNIFKRIKNIKFKNKKIFNSDIRQVVNKYISFIQNLEISKPNIFVRLKNIWIFLFLVIYFKIIKKF